MKIGFHLLRLLVLFCLCVIRSAADPTPILFSTEKDLGGGAFVETFTVLNLEATKSGVNLIKARFDFPVTATVLSLPSGWNWVPFSNSIEVFSEFPGPPPSGTDITAGQSLSGFKFFVNQSIGSIPFTFTFTTPQFTQLTTTGTSTVSHMFSAFSAKLETSGPARPGFELNAEFSLAPTSDGINPVAEAVILQVGAFAGTIAPGSFTTHKDGRFTFEGVINGVKLEVQIRLRANHSFALTAEGRGVDLTALKNPVPVALTIGNDTGLTVTSVDK